MQKNYRVYFVIDMKSFFASVECAERGLDAMTTKLVVADSSRSESTICLAVSPALKVLGIKNRCRLYEIPKNISFIIAKPRMKKYIDYAANIYGIYLQYIDKNDIHVYSIDECILDVTDYLKIYNIKAKEFAIKLMTEIKTKLHIPSSAGIGTNMYLAKIALDITAKHSLDGIGWLTEQKFIKELWNHRPLTDFWGISTGIASRLEKYGIFDMEGIAKINEEVLYKEFGVNAEILIDHSKGVEPCLMKDIKSYRSKSKSLSNSQILPCNYSFEKAKVVIKEMIQNGCIQLFSQHYVTNLVHVYIGYGDVKNDFSKGTIRLPNTSNLYSIISPYVEKLFNEIADKNKPIRKLGFDFAELKSESYEQYDLFTDLEKIKKEKKLINSLIKIKENYGKNSVLKGTDFKDGATQKERNEMIGGHNSGENENAKRRKS